MRIYFAIKMVDWMIAATLGAGLLLLMLWWLRRDTPPTGVSLREDAASRVREATLRYAASAADKQRLTEAFSSTDGSEFYSVRHSADGVPAYLEDDVKLYPGRRARAGRSR